MRACMLRRERTKNDDEAWNERIFALTTAEQMCTTVPERCLNAKGNRCDVMKIWKAILSLDLDVSFRKQS